ncbi:MAG TPA: hypothetical protein VGB59_12980 [Allosphingosinicella sp.]|jgi:predicted secreted protein
MKKMLLLAAALAAAPASLCAAEPPPPADPLTVRIHAEDADRFASLFARTGGAPTAAQLQAEYLDGASYGVEVFTPHRIRNAEHLAAAIAKNPDSYRRAIATCLPAAKEAEADLRSVYLGMRGLLPKAKLPQIYLVFGAGNSGGTAGPGAQVLGLETLCAVSDGPAAFKTLLRSFYAHETVHTFQQQPGALARKSPLLTAVLTEGAADFITSLVTGEVPDLKRAEWAKAREAELWRHFTADLDTTRDEGLRSAADGSPEQKAFLRWVGNYSRAPEGWPHEVGYWLGMRIWQSYFAAAPDKHKAIRDVLEWTDPEAVLKASGYKGGR